MYQTNNVWDLKKHLKLKHKKEEQEVEEKWYETVRVTNKRYIDPKRLASPTFGKRIATTVV